MLKKNKNKNLCFKSFLDFKVEDKECGLAYYQKSL